MNWTNHFGGSEKLSRNASSRKAKEFVQLTHFRSFPQGKRNLSVLKSKEHEPDVSQDIKALCRMNKLGNAFQSVELLNCDRAQVPASFQKREGASSETILTPVDQCSNSSFFQSLPSPSLIQNTVHCSRADSSVCLSPIIEDSYSSEFPEKCLSSPASKLQCDSFSYPFTDSKPSEVFPNTFTDSEGYITEAVSEIFKPQENFLLKKSSYFERSHINQTPSIYDRRHVSNSRKLFPISIQSIDRDIRAHQPLETEASDLELANTQHFYHEQNFNNIPESVRPDSGLIPRLFSDIFSSNYSNNSGNILQENSLQAAQSTTSADSFWLDDENAHSRTSGESTIRIEPKISNYYSDVKPLATSIAIQTSGVGFHDKSIQTEYSPFDFTNPVIFNLMDEMLSVVCATHL